MLETEKTDWIELYLEKKKEGKEAQDKAKKIKAEVLQSFLTTS